MVEYIVYKCTVRHLGRSYRVQQEVKFSLIFVP